MAVAHLRHVDLYYQSAGSGPRLLLINGSGGDLRRHPNPFDWPLLERFEVLSYDHRGLGRSIPKDPDGQPTMADFAEDGAQLVDHLGWRRFAVLGISFGGMVAQELALSRGRQIKRLVLACTSCGGSGGQSHPLHDLYALAPELRVTRMTSLLDTRTESDERLRALIAGIVASGEGFAPTGAPPQGLVRQLEARRHHDTFDRLGEISAPTLIAAGRYDGIAPPQNSVRMAQRIPNAELAIFEGGHGFFLQDPSAWPALSDFLSG